MKNYLLILGKLIISTLLMIWLLQDMHWPEILASFRNLPVYVPVLAVVVYLIAQIVSCWRWQILCAALHIPEKFSYLLNLYFLGMFFNLFLPTSVGGDVVKSYTLGHRVKDQVHSAYSVFFDRVLGLLALICLCAMALALEHFKDQEISHWLLGLLLFSCLAIFISGPLARLGIRYFPKLSRLLNPLLLLYRRKQSLFGTFLISLFVQALGIFIVLLFGYFLNIQVSLAFYVISWTIITLATLLPVSINGIGVRETGFVYMFRLQGVEDEVSITLSILTFLVPAVSSLFGVFPLLHMKFYKKS